MTRDQQIKDVNKLLAQAYQEQGQKILREAERLYLKLESTGSLSVAELYRQDRYYKLLANINKRLRKLGQQEIKILNSGMSDLYNFVGAKTSGLIDFALINERQAAEVIDQIWCSDGKRWSDRIWEHKSQLQQELSQGLMDCVVAGRSHEYLVKQLSNNLQVTRNQSNCIARTELNRVYNRAAVDGYQQAGFTRYIFLAAHDGKVCKEDQALDGKKFLFSEAQEGVNFPPMHPNCRCTIIADRSEI